VTAFSYYARFMGSLPMHPSIYGFAIAVGAMVLVSLFTKKTPEKILDETSTGMYIRDKNAGFASQREMVLEKTMKT
jgi:hypothetical protein